MTDKRSVYLLSYLNLSAEVGSRCLVFARQMESSWVLISRRRGLVHHQAVGQCPRAADAVSRITVTNPFLFAREFCVWLAFRLIVN